MSKVDSTELPVGTPEECIQKALAIAVQFGGIDGSHHRAWAIDQMVRALTACPLEQVTAVIQHSGTSYSFMKQGESDAYKKLVADACNGEDGPETYDWDVGIAP